ncbi:hypothetical protein [Herbiconiux sp. VKM Ac-2851]|uniref:hypothetical protein n=1 Tax=Herbiconiux sp. VKM Ac-2851 TaxID=2739025 RepID=UPI0015672E90|nr:hypothetical protein [Herbiconiux sp. VKM Ac-2851]NQX34283.1 hypothetical protein [Herbiconiux sp. VKM Ac-2851]
MVVDPSAVAAREAPGAAVRDLPSWAFWVQTAIAGAAVVVLTSLDSAFALARMLNSVPVTGSSTSDEYDPFGAALVAVPVAIIAGGVILGFSSFLIVSAAVLLGLPVRIIGTARRWLLRHGIVPTSVTAAGLLAFIAGVILSPTTTWAPAWFYWPASPLVGVGILLVALGLTHLWRPRRPRDAQ